MKKITLQVYIYSGKYGYLLEVFFIFDHYYITRIREGNFLYF